MLLFFASFWAGASDVNLFDLVGGIHLFTIGRDRLPAVGRNTPSDLLVALLN